MNLATCIGCGCDDNHACGEGCYWLRVDYAAGAGVCSGCGTHVEAWDQGDRTPRARAVADIECEFECQMRGDIRHPNPERPKPPGAGACQHDWPFEDVRDDDCCRWCGMGFLRYVHTECP